MRIHIIGAGLAGLSAAIALKKAGKNVILYEGTDHAGGRCRSYDDSVLQRRIDNGNHLVFSGNIAINDHLQTIGAAHSLIGPNEAAFPFFDVKTGQAWRISINDGRFPWWIFQRSRRVPGSRWHDYSALLRLAYADRRQSVADIIPSNHRLFQRFIEPLAIAVVNANPAEASAFLLRSVLRETMLKKGGRACYPRMARDGLSESFVDPALNWLIQRGVEPRWNHRLRAVGYSDDRAMALHFGHTTQPLDQGDVVVFCVPGRIAADLLPGLTVPLDGSPILNLHYRLPVTVDLPGGEGFIGLVGSLAQWLFVRGDIASVTVSAADTVIADDPELLAQKIWSEISAILKLFGTETPPHRVVKEKMATFRQNSAALSMRPGSRTHVSNLFLAGDWTDTGLPATIEGALRSGRKAAETVIQLG